MLHYSNLFRHFKSLKRPLEAVKTGTLEEGTKTRLIKSIPSPLGHSYKDLEIFLNMSCEYCVCKLIVSTSELGIAA